MSKNKHLTHIEDEWLNTGTEGMKRILVALKSITNELSGHSNRAIHAITTKWDGAPAIIAGKNPETGQFFVATKSAFANNPKLMYTQQDIKDQYGAQEGLASKLSYALKYLSKLGIENVIQGDMLFTDDSIKKTSIDGENYITFQPNTIVYAIPVKSDLARTILAAKMGIVWHTEYNGDTIANLKASFGRDISAKLAHSRNVWYRDATFQDVSGVATFTTAETARMVDMINSLQKMIPGINNGDLKRISQNDFLRIPISTYLNSLVRSGQRLDNPATHAARLYQFVEDKLNKAIIEAKLDKTKQNKLKEKNAVLSQLKSVMPTVIKALEFSALTTQAKELILSKLNAVRDIGTFFKDAEGYKVTNPEGFVVSDTLGKIGALKLVDRLGFSQQNFNAIKDWG